MTRKKIAPIFNRKLNGWWSMRLLFRAMEKISIAAWVTRGAIVDPMDEASQLHDNRLKNAATRVRCTRFKEISSIAPGDDNWRLARDPAILQHRLMWRWWPQGAFVSSVSRSVDNGGMGGRGIDFTIGLAARFIVDRTTIFEAKTNAKE